MNTLISWYHFSLDQPDITVRSPAFTRPSLDLWSSYAYLQTPVLPVLHGGVYRSHLCNLLCTLYLHSLPPLNSLVCTFSMLFNTLYFILMSINSSWSLLSPDWKILEGTVIDTTLQFPWCLAHDRCSKVNPRVFF